MLKKKKKKWEIDLPTKNLKEKKIEKEKESVMLR